MYSLAAWPKCKIVGLLSRENRLSSRSVKAWIEFDSTAIWGRRPAARKYWSARRRIEKDGSSITSGIAAMSCADSTASPSGPRLQLVQRPAEAIAEHVPHVGKVVDALGENES